MYKIKGKKITDPTFKNKFKFVIDLSFFYFPLSILLINTETNELYIKDWVRENSICQIFVLFKCNIDYFKKYINNELSFDQLIKLNEYPIYVINENWNLEWETIIEVDKNDLPNSYISKGNFDKIDCPKFDKLEQFLNDYKLLKQEYPNPTY